MLSALLHPNLVASIFVQAGSEVPADYFTRGSLSAMKSSGLSVWICHGEQDNSVPVAQARTLADRLKTGSIPVTLQILPGQHTINPQMRDIAREWRTKVVLKRADL